MVNATHLTKFCDVCRKTFLSRKSYQKRCSRECSREAQLQYWRDRRKKSYVIEREREREQRRRCTPERVASYRRRVDRLSRLIRDRVLPQLLARDGSYCGICANKLPSYKETHIDHIVPVFMKGQNDLVNLRAVHPSCNYGRTMKDYLNSFEELRRRQEAEEKGLRYFLHPVFVEWVDMHCTKTGQWGTAYEIWRGNNYRVARLLNKREATFFLAERNGEEELIQAHQLTFV